MQQAPHDDTLRWLLGIALPSFVLGVGWLVKRLMGRKAEVVQLGLQRAQAAEIRAKIRREDEAAEFTRIRELADAAWATADRLRSERDAADVRVGQLLIERRELKEQIERVTEQLKLAEEELGLKARHDNGKG